MTTAEILSLVASERLRQQALGFTSDRDDRLGDGQWIAILIGQVGLACKDGGHFSHDLLRRQAIRIAGVAVALVEALDRRPRSSRIKDALQELADRTGEIVLMVASRDPRGIAEGPVQPYAVVWSDANAWERSNWVERAEPLGVIRLEQKS